MTPALRALMARVRAALALALAPAPRSALAGGGDETTLPVVGAVVVVHTPSGDVRCVVTESPMRESSGFGAIRIYDAHRRICVRGVDDPTVRFGGIIRRSEDVYGALITYSDEVSA